MINADIFDEKGYYFDLVLKLIVFCYGKIKEDRLKEPYSRADIDKKTRAERDKRDSSKGHIEVEDYLRNDLVNHYLKKYRRNFNLGQFSIQPGSEEIVNNIKIGIVDIRFEYTPAGELLDSTGFIFECKRLDQSARYIRAYIEEGMSRFTRKQYYAESDMAKAGMIAFIEGDYGKKEMTPFSIGSIVEKLKEAIHSRKDQLKSITDISTYPLSHDIFNEIANFKYSYLSRHIRDKDNAEISIHHLLLDYGDILIP